MVFRDWQAFHFAFLAVCSVFGFFASFVFWLLLTGLVYFIAAEPWLVVAVIVGFLMKIALPDYILKEIREMIFGSRRESQIGKDDPNAKYAALAGLCLGLFAGTTMQVVKFQSLGLLGLG